MSWAQRLPFAALAVAVVMQRIQEFSPPSPHSQGCPQFDITTNKQRPEQRAAQPPDTPESAP